MTEPGKTAAEDQAAAERKAATRPSRNTAKPDPPEIDRPETVQAAAPCEECERNSDRLEILEDRVQTIGKIVVGAIGVAAVLWLLSGYTRPQPQAIESE